MGRLKELKEEKVGTMDWRTFGIVVVVVIVVPVVVVVVVHGHSRICSDAHTHIFSTIALPSKPIRRRHSLYSSWTPTIRRYG